MINQRQFITISSEETKLLGEKIGRAVKGGEVITIEGDLGSGKTCLVKGIARGLEIAEDIVNSPTYIIVNIHKGRLNLYHIDLYRLNRKEEVEDLAITEYINSDSVVAIEWPEIARDLFSCENLISIKIKIEDEDKRSIVVSGLSI